ncbi:hypothetical protein BMETH_515_2 [methanotrophic bacterial endosymbiont of Bathymodiolus sp.]|jgi:hypothetical protein|nr:hypothetical protein BMETH_515_2 [methanotrophic bacterial endosymbiont of Bathymodiolus sp.]
MKLNDYFILALCKIGVVLFDSYKKSIRRQSFLETYIDTPITTEDFTPLQREGIYTR